jgi:CRP-like cAMP-binding protein
VVRPVARAGNLDDLASFVVQSRAGEFIFREADPGAEMYIIQEGQVEVLKQYAGEARQLAILEVGDFFGEMSLLEEQPREVSARALGDCRLLRIDQSTFDQIVREDPEIAVRMLRKLSLRLRERQEADARAAEIAQGPLGIAESPSARAAVPAPAQAPAPAPRVTVRRVVLTDPTGATTFTLSDSTEATIGRIDRATGFTPDIDLTALDTERTLSRRHAKIVKRDGEFYVREEIGTRNGTFVNGERLATGVEIKLTDGAHVRFGLVELIFQNR